MDKAKNASAWTEQGYTLFAEEGLDGIQIERLARILQLNKSGFYYYFGDMEVYCEEMLKLHDSKIDHFLRDAREVKTLDPDYLLLLIKYATMVMFQVQLTREKNKVSFYRASEAIDQKVDLVVKKMWGEFFGLQNNSDLSQRCHFIVRDMFYARVSFKNLNYPFLHTFTKDVKDAVIQLKRRQLTSDPHT